MVYCPVSLEERKWNIIKWWGSHMVLWDPRGGALSAALKRRHKSWEIDSKRDPCHASVARCLTLCNPVTIVSQAPQSMAFLKQEYWSGLPFLLPGDLPRDRTGASYSLLYWQADSGFPGGPNSKGVPLQERKETQGRLIPGKKLIPGKVPWRRKWQPTPVFLPGESHGQRSVTGYSP